MIVPVLVEQIAPRRFLARGSAPFDVTAEGDTADDALTKVKQVIEDRVARGAIIAGVEVEQRANPWLDAAGMFSNDALCDEWRDLLAEQRQAANDDENCP
ncbi:MAG: hypothetical protein KDA47_02255 [Planctomycetales bacterium]|nr:hypothetical protein [Planctomycetales bacterium]